MADASLGAVTVEIPLNYTHSPPKLEAWQRSLDGTMLVNYAVTTGDVAVTKYHFELPGITESERLTVRAEALKTGSLGYIDYITVPEVFSHDGTTGVVALQRKLSSTSTSDISVKVSGVSQTVTVTTGTNPTTGNVYVTTGGIMTFSTDTSLGTNNVIVDYVPSYTVHVLSDTHELMLKSDTGAHITRYNLVMEEI